MIGGEHESVMRLDPLFATLAPRVESASPTPGRDAVASGTATHGYLHCGPSGVGHFRHFVKMRYQFGGHVENVGSAEPAAIGRQHD
jgi:6-phosphogluconate dehydrogenase